MEEMTTTATPAERLQLAHEHAEHIAAEVALLAGELDDDHAAGQLSIAEVEATRLARRLLAIRNNLLGQSRAGEVG